MDIAIEKDEHREIIRACGIDLSKVTPDMVTEVQAHTIQFLFDTAERLLAHCWILMKKAHPEIETEESRKKRKGEAHEKDSNHSKS